MSVLLNVTDSNLYRQALNDLRPTAGLGTAFRTLSQRFLYFINFQATPSAISLSRPDLASPVDTFPLPIYQQNLVFHPSVKELFDCMNRKAASMSDPSTIETAMLSLYAQLLRDFSSTTRPDRDLAESDPLYQDFVGKYLLNTTTPEILNTIVNMSRTSTFNQLNRAGMQGLGDSEICINNFMNSKGEYCNMAAIVRHMMTRPDLMTSMSALDPGTDPFIRSAFSLYVNGINPMFKELDEPEFRHFLTYPNLTLEAGLDVMMDGKPQGVISTKIRMLTSMLHEFEQLMVHAAGKVSAVREGSDPKKGREMITLMAGIQSEVMLAATSLYFRTSEQRCASALKALRYLAYLTTNYHRLRDNVNVNMIRKQLRALVDQVTSSFCLSEPECESVLHNFKQGFFIPNPNGMHVIINQERIADCISSGLQFPATILSYTALKTYVQALVDELNTLHSAPMMTVMNMVLENQNASSVSALGSSLGRLLMEDDSNPRLIVENAEDVILGLISNDATLGIFHRPLDRVNLVNGFGRTYQYPCSRMDLLTEHGYHDPRALQDKIPDMLMPVFTGTTHELFFSLNHLQRAAAFLTLNVKEIPTNNSLNSTLLYKRVPAAYNLISSMLPLSRLISVGTDKVFVHITIPSNKTEGPISGNVPRFVLGTNIRHQIINTPTSAYTDQVRFAGFGNWGTDAEDLIQVLSSFCSIYFGEDEGRYEEVFNQLFTESTGTAVSTLYCGESVFCSVPKHAMNGDNGLIGASDQGRLLMRRFSPIEALTHISVVGENGPSTVANVFTSTKTGDGLSAAQVVGAVLDIPQLQPDGAADLSDGRMYVTTTLMSRV